MGVQNNPNVNQNVPPPSSQPPPSAPESGARPEGARPPAEGARPPAEGAQHPAGQGSGVNLGTAAPNQAQLDLANAFDNIQAQQSLINTETNAGAVETFQGDNQTARADASAAHSDAHEQIQRDLGTNSAYRSSTNIENLNQQNFANMSFRDVERMFTRFQGQGLQSNPRPNPQGSEGQSARLMQGDAQAAALARGRGEAALAGRNTRGAEEQPQPQTYRAHAFGFLARDTHSGRPMGYIVTRNPTGPQTGRTPENPENPEAHTRDTHSPQDTADAGRFATASRTRVPGERRLSADRTNEDATEERAEEGSGEGTEVAHREGAGPTDPVIAAYMARQGGGEGGQSEQDSTRDVIENAVVVFGQSSPDDSARLRSEHAVHGATMAGTGYYVHNIGLGRGGRGQGEQPFGSPEENMLRGAAGVHAGPAQDMGELRRLSLCVNGEMIDMGSPQGQARFDAICARNPEVREAAMGLVEQRRNFTTHVTANLFHANGGEPSARA